MGLSIAWLSQPFKTHNRHNRPPGGWGALLRVLGRGRGGNLHLLSRFSVNE